MLIPNQVISSGLEWAPARHKSGTSDTKRTQKPELDRAKFRQKIFSNHPRLSAQLLKNHDVEQSQFGVKYADKHLNAIDKALHFGKINLSTATAKMLQETSERYARRCLSLLEKSEDQLIDYLVTHGISEPSNLVNATTCKWWRKYLYNLRAEAQAHAARSVGLVSKKAKPYIDENSVEHFERSRIRARTYLQNNYRTNGHGVTLSLADLSDSSISNPANRRAELMTHLRGLSEWAESKNHVATFGTLTAPSRMHRVHADGRRNAKYDGTHVKLAQRYLQNIWERVRSKLKRDGLPIYGLRVAEPHHDGCPHWHILIFCQAEHRQIIKDIITDYALKDSGDEYGAEEHRVEFKDCDAELGTPVGYMAKYVSKNIDGYGLEADEDENPIEQANKSILAWARIYRIRQFQFFGVPMRAVWRELRKLKEPLPSDQLEDLRAAADNNDFKRYLEIISDYHKGQRATPIRIVRLPANLDASTGEILDNGNEGLLRKHILFDGECFPTQIDIWSKTSPADLSTQLEGGSFPSAAGDAPARLLRNQGVSLGLVSITVRNSYPSNQVHLLPKPPD